MSNPWVSAHRHSIRHRTEIEASATCGCFYCLETFPPSVVEVWVDAGATALCPSCGIDSVIGDRSGYPVTTDFLARMRRHWF